MLFPDDDGTSIVKAYYGTETAVKWEPLLEASIETATGVATRLPSAPPIVYVGWATAGFVLGWLGYAVYASRAKADKARDREAA
jgi:hypothetical protein